MEVVEASSIQSNLICSNTRNDCSILILPLAIKERSIHVLRGDVNTHKPEETIV